MNLETIFIDSKWMILSQLANYDLSPTQLAKKTKTSISNISAQIKLLEALDIVKKKTVGNVAKGKPRRIYSLNKNFAYLILVASSSVGKKMIVLNEDKLVFFSAWLLSEKINPQILLKYYLNNEQIKTANSFGFLRNEDDTIELLIVGQDSIQLGSKVELASKTYNVKTIQHTKDQIQNGLGLNEAYFKDLIAGVHVLFDKDNFLGNLKKQ